MKVCALPISSALLLFAFPPILLAQPELRIEKVVNAASLLFERNGFDPAIFPVGSFDPKVQDPMLFYLAWSSVKKDLECSIAQTFHLDNEVNLSPFVIVEQPNISDGLPRRHFLGCFFVRHRRTTNSQVESYRFVFAHQPEPVRRVLQRLLPISESDFRRILEERKMIKLSAKSFLQRFRNGKDEVNLDEVEQALLALIQNDSGPVTGPTH